MVASYTSNGRFTKQGTNDNPNTWGTVLNSQVFDLLDEAIFGVIDVDITGSSDVTLTTANGITDQARHATLELSGTIGANINLILPATEKQYFVRGLWSGAYTVTLKITGGTTVVMNSGDLKIVYTNGVNTYDMVDVDLSLYLENANNLSDLASASTARTNLGLGNSATQNIVDLLAVIYPVGSLYFNAGVATNPSTLLGFGTWTAFAAGRVIAGVGQGTDINAIQETYTLEQTGGEYTHTQTLAELFNHTHTVTATSVGGDDPAGAGSSNWGGDNISKGSFVKTTSATGGGTAFNIKQPFIAVHIWKRTA